MCGSDLREGFEGRHAPVLLDACVDALVSINVPEGRVFVDGTFGRGGHARQILSRIAPLDRLVVIDRDPNAITAALELSRSDARIVVVQGTWEVALSKLRSLGVDTWHGVLLDLGVSSPQLDDAARGFSFQSDGPLDMRMDPESGTTAADWLNGAEEKEIAKVLFEFGEEREARRIAKAICALRPLRRTSELVDAVRQAVPVRAGRKHEATRTFQAIRIQVNDELGTLERSLPQFFAGLATSGRLVVISFHSLEDRIVKRTFRSLASPPALPRHLPVRADQFRPSARLLGRSIAPEPHEILANPRSRSARLRILERLS
jgi:16S rRNA (cytosine1402-N4)-methyltransferase